MSLPASTSFINAAKADVNVPATKVQIVLGNYANASAYGSTVTSSGDDASGNYPAAGAIDGDRTEINVGAAAGADNDVGKSSWRSSGVPDNGDTVTLTINFGVKRTLNRIKLYHLNGHGLKTYKLSYWNAAAGVWTVFAATSDIVGAGQTSITTTDQLDTIDFADISSNQIMLTVTHTQVASDNANVVEIEAYRKIDISSRVKDISINRQRDYKLGNPLATQFALTLSNDDRYFSISHVPTAAETAAGFVNSELAPGVGILISMGFNYFTGPTELVNVLVGTIDRINLKPASRDCIIEGRDGMKALINKIDSTKLKSSQDIAANVQYILNRANISNYELKVDSTAITIDYFFTSQQSHLTTIQNLVQAAGDALFYFDENGIATFRFFTATTAQSHLYTSQADFEAGTLTCIATKDGTNSLNVPAEFSPELAGGTLSGAVAVSNNTLVLHVGETVAGTGQSPGHLNITASTNRINAIAVRIIPASTGTITQVNFPYVNDGDAGVNITFVTRISLYSDGGGVPGSELAYTTHTIQTNASFTYPAITTSFPVTGGTAYWIVYQEDASTGSNCVFRFLSMNIASGSWTGGGNAYARFVNYGYGCGGDPATTGWAAVSDSLASGAIGTSSGSYQLNGQTTSASGTWISPTYDTFSGAVGAAAQLIGSGTYPANTDATLYLEGSDNGTTWPDSYSQNKPNGTYSEVIANHRYWRLRLALSTTAGGTTPTVQPPMFYFAKTGTWISPTLDCGATIIAFGSLANTAVLNGGTVTFYTSSSADGVTFDPFVAASGNGQINSTVRRYLQTKAILMLPDNLLQTPSVLDLTVNWVTGTGSTKYPPAPSVFTFSFDSTMLDVEQELADNLSGDTAILNNVSVQAQPLQLTGNSTDTQWQGTIGSPPVNISASNPLNVSNGQVLTYSPVISGGMDTSQMSGASPAAAAITFGGGAAGTWKFTSIHPTLPVLQITITVSGTITDMRLAGKKFSNATYILTQQVTDSVSVAKYGDRKLSLSNPWIVSSGTANSIAQTLVTNYKTPVAYIPSCQVRPTFSAQIGDRVTIKDYNLDLSADYIIAGLQHKFAAAMDSGDVATFLTLLQVPAGS